MPQEFGVAAITSFKAEICCGNRVLYSISQVWLVEAEAVAYVVGRYCELDTSGSAFYLAAWESDNPEVVRERLGRISSTAEELIDVLESESLSQSS